MSRGLKEMAGLGVWRRGCGCVWGGLAWSGGAVGLQRAEVVLGGGSLLATRATLASWSPSALGNMPPLEMWELHPGGCGPPDPILVLSRGNLLFSVQSCTSLRSFHISAGLWLPSIVHQPLYMQHQFLILSKHKILSFRVWPA